VVLNEGSKKLKGETKMAMATAMEKSKRLDEMSNIFAFIQAAHIKLSILDNNWTSSENREKHTRALNDLYTAVDFIEEIIKVEKDLGL